MEALQSLSSAASCLHLYSRNSSGVILEHYNHTGRLQNRLPEGSGVSLAKVTFLIISFLTVLENLLVLLAVLFQIRLHCRWVYICIANITLSDLMAGVAYVVNLLMSGRKTFQLSPTLWLFREGVLFVALAASVFSLLLVAMERYTIMMKPVPQKSAKKTYRIYSLVALCWLLALVIGFLPMLGWNCICQMGSCSTLLPLYSKSYIFFSLAIFALILMGIGVLYGTIFLHVRSSTDIGPARSRARSLRLLKTVICIVGAFVICWGPLFTLLLVDLSCQSRACGLLPAIDWAIALAVLNSAINPIIYSLGSTELRRAIVSLLCCCRAPAGPRSKETESTSESLRHHSSLRGRLNRARSLSTSSPSTAKTKKSRLGSTTSCLSVSSG